ncbi:MAG TPA: hypothetical protein VE218_07950, partial [Acidobacteriaceae bacterium]|nr:hypothetical protein [Acidobacteriaceae bacterium]
PFPNDFTSSHNGNQATIHSKNLPNHPTQFATLKIETHSARAAPPKSHHSGGFLSFHGQHPSRPPSQASRLFAARNSNNKTNLAVSPLERRI